jgi:hypothetical protein
MIVFKFELVTLAVLSFVVFVADSVKSNPLAELFADEGNLDSNSLKASRIYFARDFDGYIDNLLTPEKRATSPSSSDIINGFSLKDDNHYNEFQSDSNTTNDNTAKVTNSNLKTIINNKLAGQLSGGSTIIGAVLICVCCVIFKQNI